MWLLGLREGAPLSGGPDEVATSLQDHYAREGYTEARVSAVFDRGHLTLRVEEGRIDEIELQGLDEHQAATFRDRFAIKPGDVYNKRTVGQAVTNLLAPTGGAMQVGRPRSGNPDLRRHRHRTT